MNKSMNLLAVIAATLILSGCHDEEVPIPDNTPTPLINTEGEITVSGDAIRDETLMASVSDFNGVSGAIGYQWAADGAAIAGATDSSYVLTANEVGAAITVTATYTDDEGFAESVTSDPTDVVTLPPNVDGEVTISGVPTVGEMLTATVTDDNGTTTSTIAYQWLANGAGIAGATMQSYTLTAAELGATITVNATYSDDEGYAEDATSDPVGPVADVVVNVPGTIAISGTLLVGEALTANVDDANGASGAISYQWQSDGADIVGATTDTYTLTSAEKGTVISVTASYTDDAGFSEGPISDTAADIIFTAIVTNEVELLAAAGAAVDGDVIGIDSAAGGDYNDMPEVEFSADNLLIKRTTGSTAVIAGSTCIVYASSSSGITIDGLVFDDLSNPNTPNCGEGEGSIRLQGSNNTFSNNQILGQAETRPAYLGVSDELHYMTVGGTDNVVERNLFEGLPTSEAKEGAAISMFISAGSDINVSNGSSERNIIQYNLFRNFLPDAVESDDPTEWDTDSNGFGVQVGRSSGSDGTGLGAHVVQYNRFDTVLTDRRVILVQGGGNTIHGNTIVNSWGNVALEHGYGNTVSNNIIISNGTGYVAEFGGVTVSDNLDGGISFVPLGHTIINNYVGNIASNSSDRAGLLIDSETLEPSDSSTFLILGSALDLTTVVARNTVINARNAIQFEHNADEDGTENCTRLDYLLDFDDNLVANQSSGESIFGTSAGAGRTAILLDEYTTPHGCRLDNASAFTNTHIYSQTISDDDILLRSGANALVTGVDGNIAVDGSEDGATLTAPDANGLVEGTGADAGIGADIDSLTFITEDMVGPGSTWTAAP
jgi:poly(beta-D-mannuronate) lyase